MLDLGKRVEGIVAPVLLLTVAMSLAASAEAAQKLNRLLEGAPAEADSLAVLFNFTNNGCLPSPAISNTGEQNLGLNNTGGKTGQCQYASQLDFSSPALGSNTYYRKQCLIENETEYCSHMYALYFMKDQPMDGSGGHRNDWEWAMVWTTDGTITHGSHSYHGDTRTEPVSKMSFGLDSHARFVYDQTGKTTHTMYFYPRNTGDFYNQDAVTPTVVDWYQMVGDGVTNATLKDMFNTWDYGKANCSFNDNNFADELVKAIPDGYPSNSQQWKVGVQASINLGHPVPGYIQ